MILVEHGARGRNLDVIGRLLFPRQGHQPVEVRTNDAVLGTRLRNF
jgi:hypothetical protein